MLSHSSDFDYPKTVNPMTQQPDIVTGVSMEIGHVTGSRYMARLRATGADWGLDTRIIF